MSYVSNYGEGRGNGYNYDLGMSNNALDAYDRGVKPLSRITLEDLKEAGWKLAKSFALFLASSGFWRSTEWHHSGGDWYNRIDFFDPKSLSQKWEAAPTSERDGLLAQYKESRVKPSESESEAVRVSGSYTIWGGSRRRPRRMGEQKFTGVKRGGWIHLDSGGKKKVGGRYLTWSKVET